MTLTKFITRDDRNEFYWGETKQNFAIVKQFGTKLCFEIFRYFFIVIHLRDRPPSKIHVTKVNGRSVSSMQLAFNACSPQ